MNSPLRITYELVGTGWSLCVVEAAEQRVEISASYLSDALGNLVLLALAAVQGFHCVSFGFDQEPGEYRWVAESVDANLLKLTILEFPELWGNKPNSDGKQLFEITLKPLELAEAVSIAASDVLHKYGVKGYVLNWVEHPFPERALAMLKSATEARQQ